MKRRLLELTGAVTIIMVVGLLLKLAPIPVAGQEEAAPTPWGEPNLQGIWSIDYQTPLERPAEFADQEFFTDEQRAALDGERTRLLNIDRRRTARGSEQDVGSAYDSTIFISHKHVGRRTSLIVDPPDGRLPALTPEAETRNHAIREYQLALLQATTVCKNNLAPCAGGQYGPPSPRRAESPPYYPATGAASGGSFNRSDGPEDRGLSERCLSARLPDFRGFRQIVQSPGMVSIFYDTGQGQGWQRIIPVTDRPHLPPGVRQWWGDSRGRWEGNTLVVDVTNFSAKTDVQGSRENLHLVERWTRLDAETIGYTATMEDPTTWTRPWTVALELNRQPSEANRIYKEPRCHEGNYGMPGLLAGERAVERAFSEDTGPDPATLCSAGCGGFGAGFAESGDEADPLRR